ncbi:MAG TPA: ribonuclease PH [Firmicutes bacterium]|nr:ribonuclease PH [Bacillota bacterium]
MRKDGRKGDELRPLRITRSYLKYPEGSALIELGDTHVLCTASVEEKVPQFLNGTDRGWITAEYAMLPRSTAVRVGRERAKVNARSLEIQRLIGRSLRAVTDLTLLGTKTIWIDCDVLQADGGTRTAAISGAYVALAEALLKLIEEDRLEKFPLGDYLAAVSVGVLAGETLLDLDYEEDAAAAVDTNIVMTGSGGMVEVQGSAEENPFSRTQLNSFLDLAGEGIKKICACQKEILGPRIAALIEQSPGLHK